jgi:hypothetical protein
MWTPCVKDIHGEDSGGQTDSALETGVVMKTNSYNTGVMKTLSPDGYLIWRSKS